MASPLIGCKPVACRKSVDAAPVKTEIEVKSDSAYTEIHEGNIGNIPTKEIAVAHGVDCAHTG